MPATRWGIYHNLRESKYVISNSEVTFYFSSEFYLTKFMDSYQEHREQFNKVIEKSIVSNPLNMDTLADVSLYKQIEKRGYFVRLKGAKITWDDLYHYALRKMTEKESPTWEKIQKKILM